MAEKRLDVLLTPGELATGDIAGRTVVVLDVLRATTSIVEAMASGARTLFPVATIEEAIGLAKTLGREEVLLAGERKALPIEGFDLGNSPGDFTAERVGGKFVVMSTTNGTLALMAAASGERVIVGAWTNFQAVVDDLVRTGADPVFLCAGRDRVFGLEDAVCAGQMAAALMKALPETEWELNDGAVAALALAEEFPDPAALFPHTTAGRAIVDAGLGEDLEWCARTDLRDVLPVLEGRQIVLAAVEAES
ncbi:MAG TPA: 2-phosphosulfolactate phosphatase [Longimicrobium sp.]|nr:2-phosphosulfolactate phosphatase [Longimicrobium sp.]